MVSLKHPPAVAPSVGDIYRVRRGSRIVNVCIAFVLRGCGNPVVIYRERRRRGDGPATRLALTPVGGAWCMPAPFELVGEVAA